MRYVKSKSHSRTGIGNIKDQNDNIVTDDKYRAEFFFSSIFTIENSDVPNFECRCEIVITVDKVRQLLRYIISSKSVGPDNVHPRFLKELANELALHVFIILNKSLSEGELPHIWKSANVSGIFKSGDKAMACNYRPISITSVLCRVLEKIIRSSIMSFCTDNELFANCQFGFRDRR